MTISSQCTLPTIDFVGGATQVLGFRMRTKDGKAGFNLSGCTANFAVINCVHKNGAPVISKEMTVTSSSGTTNDMLVVSLDPDDTIDLCGKYLYQIAIVNDEGDIEIPKQGYLLIRRNINKQFVTYCKKTFMMDSDSEAAGLPGIKEVQAGSEAISTETGNVYVLNNAGEWVNVEN